MYGLSVNGFLKEYALYFVIAIILIIVIVIIIMLWPSSRRKKGISNQGIYDSLVIALGGIVNINSASAKGSRLSVVLEDKDLLDEEKVKEIGVASLIKMSTKIILVIGPEAGDIVKYFETLKKEK